MKRTLVAVLLGIGATSIAWASAEPSEAAGATEVVVQPGFEQVDSFRFVGRLNDWSAIDRDTLIVWTTPFRPYLIELQAGAPSLRFSQVIGVTSTAGRVDAGVDSIRLRGFNYPIEAIYKLTKEEARQLEKAERDRRNS